MMVSNHFRVRCGEMSRALAAVGPRLDRPPGDGVVNRVKDFHLYLTARRAIDTPKPSASLAIWLVSKRVVL